MSRNARRARTKSEAALRRTRSGLQLLARLAVEVDDAMLRSIAGADYGQRPDEHLAASMKVRDELDLSSVPSWYPGEVLELSHVTSLERGHAADESLRRAHLERAFCCATLLAAAGLESIGYEPLGENRSLARLVDSLIALGPEAVRP